MGPIQVVVQDGNNLVLEVTPTPNTTVILDRGIAGPPGPTGTGDVDGPASATDNAVARFDGTTGKLIQNSVVTISDTGNMAGVGTLAVTDLTDSSLTSGRVTYAGAGGNLVDSANLTFNGTDLTVSGAVNAGSINATTLDLTNLEVTNIKAKDGTSSITLADSTGVASFVANPVLSAGVANGVAFLNGSKVLTTGSALTFDGSRLGVGISPTQSIDANGTILARTNLIAYGALVLQRSSSSLELPVATYSNGSGSILSGGTKGDIVAFGNAGGDGVIFANGNAEQMRLTSTGLGIGTSSPGAKLDVQTSGVGIQLKQNATGSATYYVMDNTVETGGKRWRFGYTGAAGIPTFSLYNQTDNLLAWAADASGNLGLGVTPSAWSTGKAIEVGSFGNALYSFSATNLLVTSNAYFNGGFKYGTTAVASAYQQDAGVHKWLTAPSGTAGNAISFTQAMTLNAAGNLFLGSTTAPTGFARVSLVGGESSGSGANSGIQLTYNASTFGGGAITTVNAAGGGLSFYTFTGNVGSESYTERARIDSSGNFNGANTTGMFRLANSARSALLPTYAFVNAADVGMYNPADGTLGFVTGQVERARITSGGNLLVGTTSDTIASITQNSVVARASNGSVLVHHENGNTGSNFAEFGYASTSIGSISQSGTTAVLYNTTSDYRLKTVIGSVSDAGQRIDALQPVEYEWKSNGSRTRGFLAHQFQEVYAGSVTGTKDAVDAEGKPVYQSMQASSSEVIADLVAELKSLRARVAALEN